MTHLKSLSSVSLAALMICLGCGSSDTSTGNTTSSGGQVSGGGAGTTGDTGGSAGTTVNVGGTSTAGGGAGGASAGAAGTTGGGTGGISQGGGGAGGTNAGGAGGQAGAAGNGGTAGAGGAGSMVTFFVTSATSMTGNLGGIEAADTLCDTLATAAGHTGHTWRAYLSTSTENAGERIGQGPWYNSAGVLLANNLTDLHAMNGDYELFLDENGDPINGQWDGSPEPNEHDILTGSNRDGTLATGLTCEDWTSDSDQIAAQVGHSDGLGPNGSADPMYQPWNTTHTSESCADTAPRGGAGRFYCFASD